MKNKKYYTSRILQRIDKYNYNGIFKCMLYSEINTNVEVGDMVFIKNGHLDSSNIYKTRDTDRHSSYMDGYKVLLSDKGKIVIDYNYNNLDKSYEIDNIDKFISVYRIKSLEQFKYYDKINITTYNTLEPIMSSKFKFGQTNNIIYIQDVSVLQQIVIDNTISLNYRDANGNLVPLRDVKNVNLYNKSFYAKSAENVWEVINNHVDNNFKNYFYQPYTNVENSDFHTNKRIYPFDSEFTYKDITFKPNNYYKWGTDGWFIDEIYKQPIISKLSFSKGIFIGNHNDGIFGDYKKEHKWNPNNKWNSGFLINTIWSDGTMNSKSDNSEQSHYNNESNDGKIISSTDYTNNSGFGYNFIENCTFLGGVINNGNFINSTFIGNATTNKILENYINKIKNISNLNIKGGNFEFSKIENSLISSSSLINSDISNSDISNSKMINSQLESCVASGEYNTRNSISIKNIDIHSIKNGDLIDGILKLYITEEDYSKLKYGKIFHINKLDKNYILNSLNDDLKINLPIETKYILDSYFNTDLSSDLLYCYIKTKTENRYIKRVIKNANGSYSEIIQKDNVNLYSIDLNLGKYLANHYTSTKPNDINYIYPSDFHRIDDLINLKYLFTDISINKSSFVNGILYDTNIENAEFVNNNNTFMYTLEKVANNVEVFKDELKIVKSNSNLIFTSDCGLLNFNERRNINKIVWINELYFKPNNSNNLIDLKGAYKITTFSATSPTLSNITISPILTSLKNKITNNVSSNGKFIIDKESLPSFISLSNLKIENCNIISGHYNNIIIENSNIENYKFNSNDSELVYDNIKNLIFTRMLFNDNSVTINSGLFYKSHFYNSNYNNGMLYNSVWNNINNNFNDGVFKSGYWLNGTFNNGLLLNSDLAEDGITWTTSKTTFSKEKDKLTKNVYLNKNWRNGIFNGGTITDSFWINGKFNGGKFVNSIAKSGTFEGGILGDSSISHRFTRIGNTDGDELGIVTLDKEIIVENALVGGKSKVDILNATFRGGVLTAKPFNNNIFDGTWKTNWYNGKFEGGIIENYVKWHNGDFNGGKFLSSIGTITNIDSKNYNDERIYCWLDGNFNGGSFGDWEDGNIPNWLNGRFFGGTFSGRFWKDGTFYSGKFEGGALRNPIFETDYTYDTNIFNKAVNNILHRGIWLNGKVSERKYEDDFNNIYLNIQNLNNKEDLNDNNMVEFDRVLWRGGKFNHDKGFMKNSIWIDGSFDNGVFETSIFNVNITASHFNYNQNEFTNILFDKSVINHTNTFNFRKTCIWNNGTFKDGVFNYSIWNNGIFKNGTMLGGIWENGIWENGNANNILWKDGTWKDGTWRGNPFTVSDFSNVDKKNISLQVKNNLDCEGGSFKKNPSTNRTYVNNLVKNTLKVSPLVRFYNSMDSYNIISNNTDLSREEVYPSMKNNLYIANNYTYIDKMNFGKEDLSTPINWEVKYDNINNKEIMYVLIKNVSQNTKSVTGTFLYKTLNDTLYNNEILDWNGESYLYFKLNDIPPSSFTGNINIYFITESFRGEPLTNKTIISNSVDVNTTSANKLVETLYFNEEGLPYISINNSNKAKNHVFIPIPKGGKYLKMMVENKTNVNLNLRMTSVNDNYSSLSYANTFSLINSFIGQSYYEYDFGNNGIVNASSNFNQNHLSAFNINTNYYYGNGEFLKGLWVKGTWIDGVKDSSDNILYASEISNHYKLDDSTHIIKIEISSNSLNNISSAINKYKIGDKITISNIIALDNNEERFTLKSEHNISNIEHEVNKFIFTIEIKSNEPIVFIKKDSDLHNIKISNNVWLNGTMYAGFVYNSIFNNIKIRSNNNSCRIHKSHFTHLDIIGGYISNRIPTTTKGIINNETRNNTLIQTMNFEDGLSFIKSSVISDKENVLNFSNRRYRTILDLDYNLDSDDKSHVNIISNSKIKNPLKYNYILDNRSFITKDVLSSTSLIVNNTDLSPMKYSLGCKYKIYDSFLPNQGKFDKSYLEYKNMTYKEAIDIEEIKPELKVYKNEFSFDKWTMVPNIRVKVDETDIPQFALKANTPNDILKQPLLEKVKESNLELFVSKGSFKLDNEYAIENILPNRYTMLEYNIKDSTIPISKKEYIEYKDIYGKITNYERIINTNLVCDNLPNDYNTISKVEPFVNIPFNTTHREFYFNKKSLNMNLVGDDIRKVLNTKPTLVTLNYLNLFEVDMLPFFKYYTNESINNIYEETIR